jgi:hypothetical protein
MTRPVHGRKAAEPAHLIGAFPDMMSAPGAGAQYPGRLPPRWWILRACRSRRPGASRCGAFSPACPPRGWLGPGRKLSARQFQRFLYRGVRRRSHPDHRAPGAPLGPAVGPGSGDDTAWRQDIPRPQLNLIAGDAMAAACGSRAGGLSLATVRAGASSSGLPAGQKGDFCSVRRGPLNLSRCAILVPKHGRTPAIFSPRAAPSGFSPAAVSPALKALAAGGHRPKEIPAITPRLCHPSGGRVAPGSARRQTLLGMPISPPRRFTPMWRGTI